MAIVFGAKSDSTEITCYVEESDFPSCTVNESTAIKSEDVVLKHSNTAVMEIISMDNKNIEYLPIRVYESFPYLSNYNAAHCAIKKLSRKNFYKLSNLVTLYLNQNKITRIEDNTFDDLVKLETLSLSKL